MRINNNVLSSEKFQRNKPLEPAKKVKIIKKKDIREGNSVVGDDDEFSNSSSPANNIMDDNLFDEFDANSPPIHPLLNSQTRRHIDQSAKNRKKFVDLRPGKKGRSHERLSTVNLVVKEGQQEIARVSKVLKVFSSEISKEKKQEERSLLSSSNYKRTHNVPEPEPTHESPRSRNIIAATRRLVAGNDLEALRVSTSTMATMQTVRASEVMKPAEVDFGLTETEIKEMNYDSLNSFAQNTDTTKMMNETFGTEILKKEVAQKYNREKRLEAANEQKKVGKKDGKKKLFKVNPFSKISSTLQGKKSKNAVDKKVFDI